MKTRRLIVSVAGWAISGPVCRQAGQGGVVRRLPGYRETVKTVEGIGGRGRTQLKLGVNEREHFADGYRAATGNYELFAFARREMGRTSSFEAIAVAILILCSWGLCVLVFLG